MVIITMIDGEEIKITDTQMLVGIDNDHRPSEKEPFYLRMKYIGNLNGDFESSGSALATSDERLGIAGFLLSFDLFALDDRPGEPMYFTSAVKSIRVV